MRFDPPLVKGRLLRRYKRFFVDVQTETGETLIAHCPNTGSLLGCLETGAAVYVQPALNPKRSLRFTWKMIELAGTWVGVDTGLAVPLVEQAIKNGLLAELVGYPRLYREVKYGRTGTSRIDLLLSRGGREPPQSKKARVLPEGDERVYIEVKNTTLLERDVAMFPDAVTERGQKHLEELMHVVASGQRAAMVFCVQRADCTSLRPADQIDPAYGRLLRRACDQGVEAYAIRAGAGPHGIEAEAKIPIILD